MIYRLNILFNAITLAGFTSCSDNSAGAGDTDVDTGEGTIHRPFHSTDEKSTRQSRFLD